MERTVFHIDANSAFLSWEAAKRMNHGDKNDLRQIPSVVGGDEELRHGIVLAKSMPAAKYGIRTGEPLFSARKKCPDVVVVPPDFETYAYYSDQMAKVLSEYSPVLQRFSIDECFLDYTGMEGIFGDAKSCADRIRERICSELGFTVNIGVGPNKLLAKMAGDLQKPNMTHTIFKDEIKRKMWPLPVSDLYMVGRSTAAKLRRCGIYTIGQLASTPQKTLFRLLGKNGLTLSDYANGKDYDPVCDAHLIPVKSISNSTTLPRDLSGRKEILKVILMLCESVAARLRKNGFECSLVYLTLRYSDLSFQSVQCMMQKSTALTRDIYNEAACLLDKCWDKSPVRLVGVGIGALRSADSSQISMFDNKDREKLRKVDGSLDVLRNRYGYRCVMRASTMSSEFPSNILRYHSQNRAAFTCNL